MSIAEGFVGDIALPNVRYELEYELQSRRDKEEKLATKTGQVLMDWQIDGDQAAAEKEADQPTVFGNASTTPSPHRRHQSVHRQTNETAVSDGDQVKSVSRQRQTSRKTTSITE